MLDTVLKLLCLFIVYYVFFLTRLWYNFILFVYINTTRGTIFTINMITLLFQKFYGCKVYFTTFYYNLKYISYIVKMGGGGYVVKTYPSIDPIVAPPPPDINYIICVTFNNRERNVVTLATSRLQAGIRLCGSACNTCITASREKVSARSTCQ